MRDNARRMLDRRYTGGEGRDRGGRSTLRAAPPARVRLRCNGPAGHVFRAASRMHCPMCQHDTIELESDGEV
jgi:hypothetical protein